MADPKPFIGAPRDEQESWTCGFMEDPQAIHCSRDVTWHGMAIDVDGEHVALAMACCDEHLPQMKLSADWMHPHQHPCGIPGSWFRWPENECYLDWDETELVSGAAELTAAAGDRKQAAHA